jgi:hypothetical protein
MFISVFHEGCMRNTIPKKNQFVTIKSFRTIVIIVDILDSCGTNGLWNSIRLGGDGYPCSHTIEFSKSRINTLNQTVYYLKRL